MAPKREQDAYNVGDLVWTKVGGFPYWPGQVMDPETAPEKVKRTKQKGKVLVSFFGDNTHGYYSPAVLSRFEKNVNKFRHGVGAGVRVRRVFKRACCSVCSQHDICIAAAGRKATQDANESISLYLEPVAGSHVAAAVLRVLTCTWLRSFVTSMIAVPLLTKLLYPAKRRILSAL